MTGLELVTQERQENQIKKNGYTPEKDNQEYRDTDQLVMAAISYATPPNKRVITPNFGSFFLRSANQPPDIWPWMDQFWKPSPDDRIRELTKAAALLVAEIDRLLEQKGDDHE
jgi:hypothetical protein